MGRTLLFFLCAAVAFAGSSSTARAQESDAPCRLCSADGAEEGKKPARPVSLDVETSLDFDRLILIGSGAGSAELDPNGGRRVSGSIATIGARAMVGEAVIRGEPGRDVRVELPDRIELSNFAGGSISLESIRSDLPAMPRLDSDGRLSFRFGGVLRVSGDLDGEFRGDVPIDVEYF